MEKSELCVVIKHCFLMRKKIMFKQSNGLISVIWTLHFQKQWLRAGMLTLNMVIQTNDIEHSGHPNSVVVLENTHTKKIK